MRESDKEFTINQDIRPFVMMTPELDKAFRKLTVKELVLLGSQFRQLEQAVRKECKEKDTR